MSVQSSCSATRAGRARIGRPTSRNHDQTSSETHSVAESAVSGRSSRGGGSHFRRTARQRIRDGRDRSNRHARHASRRARRFARDHCLRRRRSRTSNREPLDDRLKQTLGVSSHAGLRIAVSFIDLGRCKSSTAHSVITPTTRRCARSRLAQAHGTRPILRSSMRVIAAAGHGFLHALKPLGPTLTANTQPLDHRPLSS